MSRSPKGSKRRKTGNFERTGGNKHEYSSFLIVCEGEKTEPNYFKGFRRQKALIKIKVHGEGANTLCHGYWFDPPL